MLKTTFLSPAGINNRLILVAALNLLWPTAQALADRLKRVRSSLMSKSSLGSVRVKIPGCPVPAVKRA